jgi:SAM-dependent methyltransferase
MSVVWHDLECGRYAEDLPVWRALAARHGDPILDIGAGTGRVALHLARAGHAVTALDREAELLEELERRAGELPVRTIVADACAFSLSQRFALCLVPMQTLQLLGGPRPRAAFLACAARHLRPGGRLAAAIVESVECYEADGALAAPLPDVLERDGTVYFSQPTAVRCEAGGFVLERRRERVGAHGEHTVEDNVIHLDGLDATQLETEGAEAGLRPAGRRVIPATDDHVGSVVVMLDA